jgi:hypothetical protein
LYGHQMVVVLRASRSIRASLHGRYTDRGVTGFPQQQRPIGRDDHVVACPDGDGPLVRFDGDRVVRTKVKDRSCGHPVVSIDRLLIQKPAVPIGARAQLGNPDPRSR